MGYTTKKKKKFRIPDAVPNPQTPVILNVIHHRREPLEVGSPNTGAYIFNYKGP
jgi:hypothetical protein